MREIYFDNSATTKQLNIVSRVMVQTAEKYYGNPSSLHSLGYEAEKELRRNRQIFSALMNCDEKEIVFTSGGSESNNLAIIGYARANPRKGNHVMVTETEHPSVLECARYLSEQGYNVEYIPVDKNGIPDLEWIRDKVNEKTVLVSVQHVNSETGSILPVKEICKAIKAKNENTAFHTDCVQSFGKLRIDIKDLNCDMLSISAHKIGGPRGIGALYVKRGIRIEPVIFGGGQEGGLRSGTENLPGIAGFAEVARIACGNLEENHEKVKEIRDYVAKELGKEKRVHVISNLESSLPYILNVAFEGIKGEVLLHSLEAKGVYVSTGSACSTRKSKRSHVLSAMNIPNNIIDGAIRISFSSQNTLDEAVEAVGIIKEEVSMLRRTR